MDRGLEALVSDVCDWVCTVLVQEDRGMEAWMAMGKSIAGVSDCLRK